MLFFFFCGNGDEKLALERQQKITQRRPEPFILALEDQTGPRGSYDPHRFHPVRPRFRQNLLFFAPLDPFFPVQSANA